MTQLAQVPTIGSVFRRSLLPGRRHTGLDQRELTVADYRADGARLALYQRLCGFDVSTTMPATFIQVLAFPLVVSTMGDRHFPFPLLGLVHVENSMHVYRSVDVSEPLGLRVWASNVRVHKSGRQVDLNAEVTAEGELVWTGVSTYLHRESTGSGRSGEPSIRAVTEAPVPTALWRLPRDAGRRYGEISGDRNPIHLSALSAKAFGFPRAIAHGMWLHARALASVASALPDAYAADASFKTPALLPSTVALEAIGLTTPRSGAARDTDVSGGASQRPCEPVHSGDWTLKVSNARTGKPHLVVTTRPR